MPPNKPLQPTAFGGAERQGVGQTNLRTDQMQQVVIRLVGPGGAGKTTTGGRLAQRLGLTFVDLDERFAATHGEMSEYLNGHGYTSYAMQNVQIYLEVIVTAVGPHVLALSSGFMTYATDVHPDYARVRGEIAASVTTLVLLPSLDYETCVAETVRRQLGRPFCRSAEREEEVIRQRFGVYRNLSATKLETMNPISDVIDAAVANLLPNTTCSRRRQARS
jgi:shikimate kinase